MKKLIYLIGLLALVACQKPSAPIDYSVGLHYKGSVWVDKNRHLNGVCFFVMRVMGIEQGVKKTVLRTVFSPPS